MTDQWVPATSDLIIACVSGKRYWDDLATRKPYAAETLRVHGKGYAYTDNGKQVGYGSGGEGGEGGWQKETKLTHAGAPLLDYWEIPLLDGDEERRYGPKPPASAEGRSRAGGAKFQGTPGDGKSGGTETGMARYEINQSNPAGSPLLDYWVIPPGGYTGSHYAVFPPELVVPLVKAMTPEKVCRECGEPSRRIVETSYERLSDGEPLQELDGWRSGRGGIEKGLSNGKTPARSLNETTGWTDCGHNNYRPGLVLDPFAGSGTTLLVATGHGHDAVGIDLDRRNAELALQRVGPFLLEVV